MPALPGAQNVAVDRGLCASFQLRACSRPPPPTTRTAIGSWSAAGVAATTTPDDHLAAGRGLAKEERAGRLHWIRPRDTLAERGVCACTGGAQDRG
eukprot:scaffold149_cov383-Prasinococcus_capsulatus_cf.AAC.25